MFVLRLRFRQQEHQSKRLHQPAMSYDSNRFYWYFYQF
nr:MAG TPA: hypothetical protein [Caudoviricetes sp.]